MTADHVLGTTPGGRAGQFRRGSLVFDVRDEGPLAGAPVVLLHGFPQDSRAWDRVAPSLHHAGLRTLAPDQRGYSPGARPGGRRAYAIPELADDVLALLDDRGLERAHVVGHDWGGTVAWALAGRAPDRVGSVTVVSTPHPAALVRASLPGVQAIASSYMGLFQVPWLPEFLLAPTLEPLLVRTGLPRDLAARYAARMRQPGALSAALSWYRALPLALRGGGEPVRRSRVPTTYVWGSRDPALRRRAAELTGRYVVGPYRFEVLDAGHWLPELRSADVAALVVDRVRSTGPTGRATSLRRE
ncbi:alpha/beta fold hydrolase [Cellulomonas fimi]|uniref:Alpha/beta hydrolase n=1 Tax=Cellulomonas fimi TaxID=1708 RepID=A0A7Y0QJ74_CELFI|nr:alpha/beta hydrolase [Cellulomonas fimi]NMR21644.1 alpha/beta hydrolase [Cellulomonas fimi]